MPTQKSSGDLVTLIGEELADNNAGLISARDVRHNMEDIVISGPWIMANSDTEDEFYFRNSVKASGGAGTSKFITEAGISFPNSPEPGTSYTAPSNLNGWLQIEPYPGASNINHDDLGNRDNDDAHDQYLLRSGGSANGMLGNLRMTQDDPATPNWIGPSGLDDEGFKFDYDENDVTVITTQGRIVYADNSTSQDLYGSGTAKGVAKAWCNFDASGDAFGTPVIRSSYNINSIERVSKGVIKISFASGIFADNNYVAIGNSNANTGSGTFDSFDINSVGLMLREGDDGNDLRSIHYVIRSDDNDLVDAEMNDFVAYGLGPATIPDPAPTATNTGE